MDDVLQISFLSFASEKEEDGERVDIYIHIYIYIYIYIYIILYK